MSDQPEQKFHWVGAAASWEAAVRELRTAAWLGLDTEADSRHHYPEKVCLIQIASPDATYVVDPLAGFEMDGLGELLADDSIEKILHGADFDLRGMNRDWGWAAQPVFDTNIAARFVGQERLGLAALLEDLLNVVIPKETRLQRADWSKRPLSEAALAYAAADVAHLGELRDTLAAKVAAAGRTEWVREECERMADTRYVAPDPETAFMSVKGAGALEGRALAVFRELHAVREAEALRLDRPPFYVLPTDAMVALSRKPETELEQVPGLHPTHIRRLGNRIKRAVSRGVKSEPVLRSGGPARPRPTGQQMNRLARLKKWRSQQAEPLKLDPSLLWPMRSLDRLSREPDTFDEELTAGEVRRWQVAEFADAVRQVLAAR